MEELDFTKGNGLIPAIIQDDKSNEVYMLGYMNDQALAKTKATGLVHFWSRKRKKLWMKGEESDNKLHVLSISVDCDKDALLIKVTLDGKHVCHTDKKTCFHKNI